MTGVDGGANVVAILLMMVLAVSALAARRIPGRAVVRMTLGWIAIFGLAFLLFVERDMFDGVAAKIGMDLHPDRAVVSGDTVRIAMAADGHFWVRGRIGTRDVRFLIDSGATITALSSDLVREIGLTVDDTRPVLLRTANGIIQADRVEVPSLAVGTIAVQDFTAITTPAFGDVNVLGMNFLSGLKRWGVEGRTLILTPR